MKKHIRSVINDLKKQSSANKNASNQKAKTNPVAPGDLDNQTLSKDPAQRVRQLDWQAQQSERRQTNS